MKPVEPMEISAFIDGELPPDRVVVVRQAIADEPALHELYERLTAVDADLNHCAAAAAFQPRISLAGVLEFHELGVLRLTLLLLAARIVTRLIPMELGVALQVIILFGLLTWLVVRLVRLTDPAPGRSGSWKAESALAAGAP